MAARTRPTASASPARSAGPRVVPARLEVGVAPGHRRPHRRNPHRRSRRDGPPPPRSGARAVDRARSGRPRDGPMDRTPAIRARTRRWRAPWARTRASAAAIFGLPEVMEETAGRRDQARGVAPGQHVERVAVACDTPELVGPRVSAAYGAPGAVGEDAERLPHLAPTRTSDVDMWRSSGRSPMSANHLGYGGVGPAGRPRRARMRFTASGTSRSTSATRAANVASPRYLPA